MINKTVAQKHYNENFPKVSDDIKEVFFKHWNFMKILSYALTKVWKNFLGFMQGFWNWGRGAGVAYILTEDRPKLFLIDRFNMKTPLQSQATPIF